MSPDTFDGYVSIFASTTIKYFDVPARPDKITRANLNRLASRRIRPIPSICIGRAQNESDCERKTFDHSKPP
ncbi:hypothetical protein BQ8482_490068 [Mesorhizobium delmotii]|uniref:Uncharacterized protein n=1 Tax=Mesorhizobium delmotii TaxID=1631247 RepID=A0A2P9AU84_9HYPH|nr:hypothetical protein BQ8482_490068 [Mesorhizobium delmotii]